MTAAEPTACSSINFLKQLTFLRNQIQINKQGLNANAAAQYWFIKRELKKQVIILEWDSNGHAETGHRDIFSYTSPNGSFLWFIFLSQNNLSSGNLRANWPFATKTSFHADIRLKCPRNFRINLILCLQFGVFSLTEQWNGNYYFRFGIWTEIIIIKRTSNANIWKA